MRNRLFKKLTLVIIGLCVALSFIGCSDDRITAFVKTDLQEVMASRAGANKDIAKKLCATGLITEDERDTMISTIDKQVGAYATTDASSSDELSKKLLNAIVDWSAPAFTEGNSAGYTTQDQWNEHVVTSYIAGKKFLKSGDLPIFSKVGTAVTPISILDNKTGEEINERFGYKVYVLKPFSSSGADGTISSQKSLDEVVEMISAATKDKNAVDTGTLDLFFQEAKDSNNKAVTLLDLSKRENRVIGYSKGSTLITDSEYSVDDAGKLVESTIGNKTTATISASNVEFHTPDGVAAPGNDMIVYDSSHTIPLMSIRFNEFNSAAVDNIIKTLGMNPDQYFFSTMQSQNRVYIMEYPVNYIESFKDKDDDNTKFESLFAKSGMGINLRTGKLIKYGSAWGDDTQPGVYFDDSDPYLSVKGAEDANAEGQSAFIIEGDTPDDASMEIGDHKSKVKTGRIVLRDYLEATYAPGIVSGENIVVFGRKIRILQTSGNKSNVMARYYDKEGKVIADGANLYIHDFADFEALNSASPGINHIGGVGQVAAEPTTDANETDESKNENNYSTESIQESLAKIDTIKKTVVTSIKPSTAFPGVNIGKADMGNDAKPLFYAMAVKKNMFDTALFSGWINNTDAEKKSLDWWIKWLGGSNREYLYTINKNSLEDYLMGNYTFELQKAGIIILDLETISKIQQDYVQQDKDGSMKSFRTIFVILGYFIISYGFMVLIAWNVDVNVDLGFNILEKLSLGHWVAVREVEEAPYQDTGDRHYITFRQLVVRTTAIAVVGVLLMLVNVVDVVIVLIQLFGGIAKILGKLITGI